MRFGRQFRGEFGAKLALSPKSILNSDNFPWMQFLPLAKGYQRATLYPANVRGAWMAL